MADNNKSAVAEVKTEVLANSGKMVEIEPLRVDAKEVSNFVEAHRKDYFEDHSMQWCLDTIIERGIAEIKRYIKTNDARKQQMASGALIKEYGLTPEQAKEILKAALAAKKIAQTK